MSTSGPVALHSHLMAGTEDIKCSNCGHYSPDQHQADHHRDGGDGGVGGLLVGSSGPSGVWAGLQDNLTASPAVPDICQLFWRWRVEAVEQLGLMRGETGDYLDTTTENTTTSLLS